AHRRLRFGRFEAGGFRGYGALVAVVKLNVRRGFGNRLDRPAAILRMPHAQADVKGFDFHGDSLTTDGADAHGFLKWKTVLVFAPWCGEVQRRRFVLEKIKADNSRKRARLGARQ